jgi:micrococcal nuclease
LYRSLKITALLILLLIPEALFSNLHPDLDRNIIFYKVTKVVDGDTFWVDDGSEKGLKIRLIGVDAPESRNTGKKSKAYFGKDATDYLVSLIGGKKVRFEYDIGMFDRYGRTLAYVFLENGIFVNARMVREGYAVPMTVPPNVKYADTFVDLAKRARKSGKGLWDESRINSEKVDY